MVLSSFFWATAGVLLVLVALLGFNRATYNRGRIKMARELGTFLDDADVPDLNHATGRWHGMPVRIELNQFSIDFWVELPPAVIRYRSLIARHGGPELADRMRALGLGVDDQDHLIGSTARENGLAESLITVEQRIAVADEIWALRRHAPSELVSMIDEAHSAREVDDILVSLSTHYPDSPQLAEAIELAVLRDPQHPERVRARAATWRLSAPGRGRAHEATRAANEELQRRWATRV